MLAARRHELKKMIAIVKGATTLCALGEEKDWACAGAAARVRLEWPSVSYCHTPCDTPPRPTPKAATQVIDF